MKQKYKESMKILEEMVLSLSESELKRLKEAVKKMESERK